MSYIVQIFDTFSEASQYAKHLAPRKGIELRVAPAEGRWHVTADMQVEVPDYDELGLRIQEKDAEAEELRQRMVGLERQLQQIAEEKERFHRRSIEHETKPPSEVVREFSQSHVRTPIREATCETCGRTPAFCRCSG